MSATAGPAGGEARLVREPLRSSFTAAEALLALRDRPRLVALVGVWAGSRALVGFEPLAVAPPDADPFAALDALPRVADAAPGCVGGGWFGYLGYQLGALVERLPPPPPRPLPRPLFELAYHDSVLRLDVDGRWWFEALWTPARAGALEVRLGLLRDRLAGPPPRPRPSACGRFAVEPGRAGHAAAVRACLRHIAEGDVYQANLCLRAEAAFAGDPLDAFAGALERTGGPPYAAYLASEAGATLSLSPELFLRRRGERVLTAPIKGTTRRDADPAAAERQRLALLASAKDRAENVMIVDLMRNDLGRVCRTGSVRVRDLAVAEAHPGVWHLVSHVEGEHGGGDAELVRAAFPPGSITGAPKVRAMEVIDRLESSAREAYTGAIGYASPLAGLELNVAIRTFELVGGRIWLGVGGGVVADSEPEREFEECLLKAEALVAALGSGVDEGTATSAPAQPPVSLPRPDPARGIFETLLVLDGRPVELDTHLERLAASAAALYALAPPGSLREDVLAACAEAGPRPARLRISLAPAGDVGLGIEPAQAGLHAANVPEVELEPLVLPGGLGAHKWLDRRLVESVGPHRMALVVDLDGRALEAGSANVAVVEGGALVTPPADGRILPGATRARLLGLAAEAGLDACEEDVPLERLLRADAVVLTSSVAGVRAATACGATALRRSPAVVAALRDALRRAWLGVPV